jgi:uncharacterized membrane protein YjdF
MRRNTFQSLWLSWANRATGWWLGHAANEVRRQQKAVLQLWARGVAANPAAKRKRRRKLVGRKPGGRKPVGG